MIADERPTIRTKSSSDIAAVQAVQQAGVAAMLAVWEYLQSATEPTAEAAHDVIDMVLAEHDCESPAGHIVAAGPASAEPHEIGSGVISRGVPIVVDIYPRSKETGFWGDLTRTVCLGTPPAELQKMYDTVLRAQEQAIAMVGPGVRCADIHHAVETVFAEAGFETSGQGTEFPFAEGFVHSTGHGVGQNVHEAPKVSGKSEDVLQPGNVITIEPGLYYKRIGGVRLEDLLVVTETGYRSLTTLPKKLRLLDQKV